jgi:large subunit ribosomal protein L9
MKVILIRDVARLGRRLEVKEVPAGHALNFLIPRKLSIPATPENMKRLSAEVTKHAEDREESEKSFHEALAKLGTETVVYVTEANDKGHLFKGVNARDIAEKLSGAGFSITEEDIELPHPLKSVGVHEVPLVRGSVKGVCKLEIVKK